MAASSSSYSGSLSGASSGCDNILRNRTHPVEPAARVQSAAIPASISASISISAAMITRNATTGLTRMRAPTIVRSNPEHCSLSDPASVLYRGSYCKRECGGFIDLPEAPPSGPSPRPRWRTHAGCGQASTRPRRLSVGLSAARATRARRPARPTETGRPDRQPMRSDTGIMQAAALRGRIHPSA